MKKSKILLFSALTASVMMFGTACGKKAEAPAPTPAATLSVETEALETEQPVQETDETSKEADETKTPIEEKQMAGVLDENKGFMFTMTADKDQEAYVFNTEDDNLLDGLNAGDKIVVTYTGDDPVVGDITDTIVKKVEKSK